MKIRALGRRSARKFGRDVFMQSLNGRVALVTGASRGVGKGIALELVDGGATVYITGRSVKHMRYLTGECTAIECDHRDDEQVRSAFRRNADRTCSSSRWSHSMAVPSPERYRMSSTERP